MKIFLSEFMGPDGQYYLGELIEAESWEQAEEIAKKRGETLVAEASNLIPDQSGQHGIDYSLLDQPLFKVH